MPTTPPLEQVLADARSEARALARHAPSAPIAAAVLALCDAVHRAAEDYLRWVSEPEAVLRSGRSARYWRGHFAELAAQGNAELRDGRRYYRALVVPQRADVERARAEARAAAGAERGPEEMDRAS